MEVQMSLLVKHLHLKLNFVEKIFFAVSKYFRDLDAFNQSNRLLINSENAMFPGDWQDYVILSL